MLEAFSKIENNNWRLLIAGKVEEEYLDELKKINNSDRITFLGYTKSELFFKNIDVLIVPSLWNEPFGRVVIEGIINKKPVIGSRVGGITELLTNNDQFLVEPNLEEFSVIIRNIVSNSNLLDSFVFDEELLNKVSIERVVRAYIDIFEEI